MADAARFRVSGANRVTRRDASPPCRHDPTSLRFADLVAERNALREAMRQAKAREMFL